MNEPITLPALEPIVAGLRWPECPRWHDGRIHLVDMPRGSVLRVDDDGSLTTVEQLHTSEGRPVMIGGIGWLPDGRRVTVAMRHLALLVESPSGPVLCADLSGVANGPINDLVVDRNGRIYVSQLGYDIWHGGEPVEAPLLVIEPDGTVRAADEVGHFATANGMVLSADGTTLVIAETHSGRLIACDVAADGSLSGRRVLADLPGTPDGIAIDADDGVWAALLTRRCVRIAPDGTMTHMVQLERGHGGAVACAVGDDRLFICAATWQGDMTAPDEPSTGSVWAVDLPAV